MNIFLFNFRLGEPREGSVESDDVNDRFEEDIGDDGTSGNVTKKRRVKVFAKKHICKFCGKKYFAENSLLQHIVDHGNWERHLVEIHVSASI